MALTAFFVFVALLLLPTAPARAEAAASGRAAPTRPGASAPAAAAPASARAASPTRKIGSLDYISLAEVARKLGLKLTLSDRGRKAVLAGPGVRAALENDARDIECNGLRVFLGDPVLDSKGQLYVSRIDFERCLTPLLRPGFGVLAAPVPKVVALDPGHGGRDNGTSIHEKVYALDVARRTQRYLEARGFKVVLTRDDDTFVDLGPRAAFANLKGADLFVSIHFNALPKDTRTSGVEVFTFAPQFQRSADSWSPLKEDDAEDTASPVNKYDHWSVVLAQQIQRRFVQDLRAFDRGKKLAHWGVLRPLKCPGVLVECGFLTSEAEAKKIATPGYRQQIAETLGAAIRDYAAIAAK